MRHVLYITLILILMMPFTSGRLIAAGSEPPSSAPPAPQNSRERILLKGKTAQPAKRPSAEDLNKRTERNPVSPRRNNIRQSTTNTIFDRVTVRCLEAGENLTLMGRGFGAGAGAAKIAAYLGGNGEKIALEIKFRAENRIVVYLPEIAFLRPSLPYHLSVAIDGKPAAGPGRMTALFRCLLKQRKRTPISEDREYAAGQIVMMHPIVTDAASEAPLLADALSAKAYTVLERNKLPSLGYILLTLAPPPAVDLRQAISALSRDYPDASVDLNRYYRYSRAPYVYASKLINLPEKTTDCGPGQSNVRIGMLDGGVDRRHPAIATASNIQIVRFGSKPGEKVVASDHGTAIAVMLKGQDPKKGFRGILQNAGLYAGDILNETAVGQRATTPSFLKGLDWLVSNRVRVINLSLEGRRNAAMQAGIDRAASNGIVIFAAAGNGGANAPPAFPAAARNVIGITAVDFQMNLYPYATRGPHVDFSAPGVDIWLAKSGGGGSYRSGTSFAVPYAAAIAARYLMRKGRARGPGNRVYVRNLLSETAIDLGIKGMDSQFGYGLVQSPGC